jgi:hypothetical protein
MLWDKKWDGNVSTATEMNYLQILFFFWELRTVKCVKSKGLVRIYRQKL